MLNNFKGFGLLMSLEPMICHLFELTSTTHSFIFSRNAISFIQFSGSSRYNNVLVLISLSMVQLEHHS